MDFFAGFLITFSSLLIAEASLARLSGGLIFLLCGFWAKFFGGRPSIFLAPLLLVSCFLRMFPLWRFFAEELGDVRGAALFLLAYLAVFLLVVRKKEAPPSRFIKRSAVPFSLLVMVLCLFTLGGIRLSFSESDLPNLLLCALSGIFVFPKSESLLQTYAGIGAGILLALFPAGLGRGLFLALLSPLLAAAELGMVCSLRAYNLPKKKRPRKDGSSPT